MFPYVILVIFIFLAAIFAGIYYPKSTKKEKALFICLAFIYIYFFCCLRSFEVGRDIPAYLIGYQRTESVAWNNWQYIYYENGYIALMKMCIACGFNFRAFFFVVYAIILLPVAKFIYEKSPYPLISVIIYISFQFFIFNLTGIRQSISLSILICSYLVLSKNDCRKRLLKFVLLVLLASTFHKSAIVFCFAYPISRLNLNRLTVSLFCVSGLLGYILNIWGVGTILEMFENTHYEYSTEDYAQLGFLAVAMCFIVFLAVWTYFHSQTRNKTQLKYAANILLASIPLLFLFNGSVLLRSVMYYYFPMMISLPMFVNTLKNVGLRQLAFSGITIVFLLFFFMNEINSFDVLPYKLGTDIVGNSSN